MILFQYKNLNGQQKSINLPIEQKDFNEIKRQVQHSELDDLGDWEFWELRDYLFETLIINSLKGDAIAFFEKIHLKQFEFEGGFNGNEIKVVDVYYHFDYGDEIYLFSEPSDMLYPNYELKTGLEVHLKYDTEELEHLLEQILNAFSVDYDSWQEEGGLCTDELEIGKLCSGLIFGCWQLAKVKTESNTIGILSYSSGGAGCTDLDNGNDIDESDEGTRLYLEKKGISFKTNS